MPLPFQSCKSEPRTDEHSMQVYFWICYFYWSKVFTSLRLLQPLFSALTARLLQPLMALTARLLQPLGLLQPMKLLQLLRLLQPGSYSL